MQMREHPPEQRAAMLWHEAVSAAILKHCVDRHVLLDAHEFRQVYIGIIGELIDELSAARKALCE